MRPSRGFSLLEVLVAFVILGLVLSTLMQIFSGSLRNIAVADEYQQAVLLGQSKLAVVGIETPLLEGEANGEFNPIYRWQVSIRPYQDNVPATLGQPTTLAVPGTLLQVEVRVLWGDASQPRTVSLKTLRLANRTSL